MEAGLGGGRCLGGANFQISPGHTLTPGEESQDVCLGAGLGCLLWDPSCKQPPPLQRQGGQRLPASGPRQSPPETPRRCPRGHALTTPSAPGWPKHAPCGRGRNHSLLTLLKQARGCEEGLEPS